MLSKTYLIAALLLAAVWPRIALAQAPNLVFSYKISSSSSAPAPVSSAGTIDFSLVPVNTTGQISLLIANQDTVAWTIRTFSIAGPFSSGLGLSNIGIGQTVLFPLLFSPANTGLATGSLTIQVGSGTRTSTLLFYLTGTGAAPNLVPSYVLAADGNQIPLGAGGSISFPPTQVGQTSSGTLIISNQGNGAGTVVSVNLSGAAFKLSNLPLLPAQVAPGADLRFTFTFSPAAQGVVTGSLQIAFSGGGSSVSLQGQGLGTSLVYDTVTNAGVTPVTSGATISLPSVATGSTSSLTIQVQNLGNAPGTVSAIAVLGTGFQLTGLPFLPATLQPATAISFGVTFTPSQSGPATGQLKIDNAVFNLISTGFGPAISLSYQQGGSTVALAANSTLTFANTPAGLKSSLTILVTNTASSSSRLNSITLTGAAYSLDSLPALPATLAAGQTISFAVVFSPVALGPATGSLQVGDQVINLSGAGAAPPALPAIVFTSASGSANPADQPSVGLSLASPYPLDLTGSLTLTFASAAFADDPAIQFSTGGRTVAFTIPANTTQALFPLRTPQIQFQTGTVAGAITIAATFNAGSINVTPAAAPVQSILVAPAAPQIRAVQISNRTATGFDVLVTGFATTRKVTGLSLQFTPVAAANLQTTRLDLNVGPAFDAWYQSGGSAAFGSQFTAVVTITVNGDINAVQLVSATASNDQGASAPASAIVN